MLKPSHLNELAPEEYYMSKDGYVIFTAQYHLNRGYCCKSNCMHCPYSTKYI